MVVGETVTGNGLTGTVGVPVTAVSGAPGEWAGVYTVPNQSTTLTFAGTASGYGLYTTQVSATVGVGEQTQGLSATPNFTGGASVQAGGTIPGQVVLTNQTGSVQHVKLVASVSGATATLTSPSGPVTVQSGSPSTVPFGITVAGKRGPGPRLSRSRQSTRPPARYSTPPSRTSRSRSRRASSPSTGGPCDARGAE